MYRETASLIVSSFIRGQSHPGQQNYAIIRMTFFGKQQAGKANLHGTEEGPPYMPRISWWKETPLVIGVKENVPSVCHEVLCGTNSSSVTQLPVIRLLNHSRCHLPSLFLPSCPHALFSIPDFISALLLSV